MAKENEPAKLLLPYLQRADELQKHEPLVAYYCRLYAMERGLKIPQNERTKTSNSLLVSLMKQLEKDKKALTLGPDDSLHLEGFALNVFSKADKQDRAGRADLNTAKTFYAASIFFEILNLFGELQPDIEQKQKYAAWKAADTRKALKEGRLPPANMDPHLSSPASSPTNHCSSLNGSQSHNYLHSPPSNGSEDDYQSHNFQTSSHSQAYHHQSYVQDIPSYSYPNFQSYPSFTESSLPTMPSHHPSQNQVSDVSYTTLPASTAAPQYSSCSRNKAASEAAPTSTNAYCYDSNYQPPPEKTSEALKAARFAVGALAFDDVSVAVDYIKKSLELLTNPSAE